MNQIGQQRRRHWPLTGWLVGPDEVALPAARPAARQRRWPLGAGTMQAHFAADPRHLSLRPSAWLALLFRLAAGLSRLVWNARGRSANELGASRKRARGRARSGASSHALNYRRACCWPLVAARPRRGPSWLAGGRARHSSGPQVGPRKRVVNEEGRAGCVIGGNLWANSIWLICGRRRLRESYRRGSPSSVDSQPEASGGGGGGGSMAQRAAAATRSATNE